MSSIGQTVAGVINLYVYVLFGRLIFDYVMIFSQNWRPKGAMLVLVEMIYTITDPPLNAIRKVVPPLRIGRVSLDLSFLVLLLGLQFLQAFLVRL